MVEKQVLVVISREFGSGGGEIAAALAERLDLPLYDKSILEKIADTRSLEIEMLRPFDEAPRNFFTSRSVKGFSNSPEEAVAHMQFEYILQKARAGESFVLVGRCGEEVLKEFSSVVSIFVLADIGFKKMRTMEKDHTDEEGALELMARSDRRRKYYHNQFCRGKWGDSRNYDLCINSARLGIERTVDFLEHYIRQRMKE